MNIIQSLILGVVEGVSEFLPISSTGHLEIASYLLKIAQSDFVKSFEIIIQLGAILAVAVYYFRTLTSNLEIWKKIIVAFIPTGIIGLALYKVVKTYFLGNNMLVVVTLFLGGLLLIWFDRRPRLEEDATPPREEIKNISYKQSVVLGLAQAVAIVPGVSRSAATIVGGLAMGIKRRTIVEFSFWLAIPTMLAATGLDLVKNYQLFSADQATVLLVGFVTSFVVALLSIKFLLNYIQKNSFVPFGIYRIIVSILFFYLLVK